MRNFTLALTIILSLFAWNTAAASTLLTQPTQDQQALLYYGGGVNQVNFDQGAVLGTITTLRLWLQSTTTRTVYLGWQSADGNAGNNAYATVSGGNVWQWVDFDLTWSSSHNVPIATSTRTFTATSSQFLYYIPSYQGAPDVLAGCMQATSSLVYFMGGFYSPQCGTPTFELLGASTSTPPTDPCTGVENCYSNVLFLPGLQASRLYRQYPNCPNDCERMLWTPDGSPYFEDLYLTASGASIWGDIYTRDVVDEVLSFNVYKSLLVDLLRWKNTENLFNDYVVIPYDWRLSLDAILNGGYKNEDGTLSYLKATSTPYIIQELERLAARSRTGKVIIIGHSNGGLVAKALMLRLEALGKASLVDKVVLVASPQTGTPKALGAILHGYDQGLPIQWFPFMLSKGKARTMAHNMPGAYHLLPSEQYFQNVQTPVAIFVNAPPLSAAYARYGSFLNTSEEMSEFITGSEGGRVVPEEDDLVTPAIGNHALISYAQETHRTLDAWMPPSGVEVHQIAGFGADTLSGIRYFVGRECVQRSSRGICLESRSKLEYSPEEVVDGDGTVIAASALAMGTSSAQVSRWWVDLDEYNGVFTLQRKHADILEVPELRQFIKNIFTSESTTIPPFVYPFEPPTNSSKRLRFILHSPLPLAVEDSEGRIVNASTSTIPGGYYEEFGEVAYISVPASTTPTLLLAGTAEGSFTLEIAEIEGNTIVASTTFTGIPSATNTRVQMDFPSGSIISASPLTIDYDNDGAVDLALPPVLNGVVVPPTDTTPPEIQLTFSTSTQGLITIAGDESETMVIVTSTSTTAADMFGNSTTLSFASLKEKERRIVLSMDSMRYNEEVVYFATTTLKYKWKTNKKGEYMTLAAYIKMGSTTLEAHYRPKKNVTAIMEKPADLSDENDSEESDTRPVKQVLSGLVIPGIQTNKGVVSIIY